MNRAINTVGYGTSEGWADQITLPSDKFMYTGISSTISHIAKVKGLEIKTVRYYGACISTNINDRAHLKFPIMIDGVSIADFIDKVATEEECTSAFQ